MNLFEITDEFQTPKTLPQDDLKHLERKEKRLVYELDYVRKKIQELRAKIVGTIRAPNWDEMQPDLPEYHEKIQKVIDSGFVPVYRHDHTSNGDKRLISMFVPNIAGNKDIIPQLQQITQRETKLTRMLRDIPGEIKRAKGRLSAWLRKQPSYVGRTTGKELLKELKKKVEDFIAEKTMHVTISNSYYWAKNKMIVIDISVRTSQPGMSVNQTAKQYYKPLFTKFMEDADYTQFRVTDRFIDGSLTLVKIQLDDVEAKQKAESHETE